MTERRVIDLQTLYREQAKLAELQGYVEQALMLAGRGTKWS